MSLDVFIPLKFFGSTLEGYNLSRFNQEIIENMNRTITSTETETMIIKLPTSKSPEAEGFTGEFYQRF